MRTVPFTAAFLLLVVGAATVTSLEESDECNPKCNKDGGVCVMRNGTSECLCDLQKWKGQLCEIRVVDYCPDSSCSGHGRCSIDNNTLTGFICNCENGYAGARCERAVIDQCTGSHALDCKNKGVCVNNQCECKDGFGGELCERYVPLKLDYATAGCNASCANRFGDGRCDAECNSAECFYDGYDCTYSNFDVNSEEGKACLQSYANTHCQYSCSSPEMGFDGGDCFDGTNGSKVAQLRLKFEERPAVVYLRFKYIRAFLARTLRAVVSLSKSRLDQGSIVYAVNVTSGERRLLSSFDDSIPHSIDLSTELVLDIDFSHCSNESMICLQPDDPKRSIQTAKALLSTLFVRPNRSMAFPVLTTDVSFRLLSVDVFEESESMLGVAVTLSISLSVTVILLLSLFACFLAKRRRPATKASKAERGLSFNDNQKSRLVAAVEEGNISSLTSLLADISPLDAANAEDVAGNTVLHMAAARDDKESVRALLHSRMFDVCSVNAIGQSPLLYALREGKPSIETLNLLVHAINEERSRHRVVTPHRTSSHLPMSPLSEEPGWGLTDSVGRSSLHYAALGGLHHLVHFLIQHGASPSLPDSSGNTPLHLAAINGHTETVKRLLDERAAVTVTNALGNTPAQVCALNGHTDLAALLMEKEQMMSTPLRERHDSQRGGAIFSTVESVFSVDAEDFVLPALLPSFSSGYGTDVGAGRLSAGSNNDPPATTPRPSLPTILTPSSQLVEVSPTLTSSLPPTTLPRSRWVERSPSDPRGDSSALTSPYSTIGGGKRRSLPDGPAPLMINPYMMYASKKTQSSTSERSQSSAGHESFVSSFKS